MKKHVFSLMMAFALIVGLSTSALAQTTLPATAADAVIGSPTNPKVFLNGATGTLSITRGVALSEVEWNLYKGTDASILATETSTPEDILTTQDLDISLQPTWGFTQTNLAAELAEFHFKWTDVASGRYYLEVTESDPTNPLCAQTMRGYHIFIFGFDVEVYASTDLGVRLVSPADDAVLAACNDNTYDAFMNNVQMIMDGTAVRTDLFNNGAATVPPGTIVIPDDGTLGAAYGNQKTRRWYTAEIYFEDLTGIADFDPTALAIFSATMDIQVVGEDALTPLTAADVMAINSDLAVDDLADDVDKVLTTVISKLALADPNKFTFSVDFADRWGADLDPVAIVTNLILYPETAAAGTALGEEPVGKEDIDSSDPAYDNISNAFTIYGKPATSIIAE